MPRTAPRRTARTAPAPAPADPSAEVEGTPSAEVEGATPAPAEVEGATGAPAEGAEVEGADDTAPAEVDPADTYRAEVAAAVEAADPNTGAVPVANMGRIRAALARVPPAKRGALVLSTDDDTAAAVEGADGEVPIAVAVALRAIRRGVREVAESTARNLPAVVDPIAVARDALVTLHAAMFRVLVDLSDDDTRAEVTRQVEAVRTGATPLPADWSPVLPAWMSTRKGASAGGKGAAGKGAAGKGKGTPRKGGTGPRGGVIESAVVAACEGHPAGTFLSVQDLAAASGKGTGSLSYYVAQAVERADNMAAAVAAGHRPVDSPKRGVVVLAQGSAEVEAARAEVEGADPSAEVEGADDTAEGAEVEGATPSAQVVAAA